MSTIPPLARKLSRRPLPLAAAIVLAAFAVLGFSLLRNTGAAGFFAAAEPENGTVASPAVSLADSTASGGKYVRFQSTAATGTIIKTVFTTAYTYFDNTPPGSPEIAYPRSDYPQTLHEVAGGTGTYADPVTVAVGHRIVNGTSIPDFAPGTRFYFPDLRKYGIVEDQCGDGPTPQNIPCHDVSSAPTGTTLWLDVWIGGTSVDSSTALHNCASIVTDSTGDLHWVVQNPSNNYAVNYPGPVYQKGYCIQPTNRGFGNTLVTQ